MLLLLMIEAHALDCKTCPVTPRGENKTHHKLLVLTTELLSEPEGKLE